MRSKPIKHEKHERLAITAFIITLAISILAFYYVWNQNVQIGRTIEGVRDYACTVYLRDNPTETSCPEFTVVQQQEEYFVGQKETIQDNGCTTISSVCYSTGKIMNNDAYSEHLLSVCSAGDKQCQCNEFFREFEANTAITSTTCIAVDEKCPFLHKKVCP